MQPLDTLKALADPSRLRLLAVLTRGEFTVQELTRILRMGQSRISRHLKILLDAGVLDVKRQGTWSYYRLGESNHFFDEIRPALEGRLAALPVCAEDLSAMAAVLEERQRRSQAFFERHASQWDALARQMLPVADYLDALAAEVPECGVLLEVGVGTGALLSVLARRAKRVVGVDHSPAMLEEARGRTAAEGLRGVELRLGEMTHLPFPNAGCEVALLNMVLHHAPRPAVVLGELGRVLAPGGTLLIADLVRHDRDWVRERLADQWLGFERDELSGWLTNAGFALINFSVLKGEGDALSVFIAVGHKPASIVGMTKI